LAIRSNHTIDFSAKINRFLYKIFVVNQCQVFEKHREFIGENHFFWDLQIIENKRKNTLLGLDKNFIFAL